MLSDIKRNAIIIIDEKFKISDFELAEAFSVHRTTICRILNNEKQELNATLSNEEEEKIQRDNNLSRSPFRNMSDNDFNENF